MHGKKIVSEKCEITVNRKIKDTEGTYILRIKNRFIASNFKPSCGAVRPKCRQAKKNNRRDNQ